MVLPCNLKDNSDSTRTSKSGKMLPDLPNVRMSSAVPKGTTKRPPKGTLRHRSINYEHAWYIAIMEGIVDTAVDTASLSPFYSNMALFEMCV